jgi:hypothetical protein
MDSLRNKMARAAHTRKAEAEEAAKRYNESSRQRLLKIMEKKFQTSFIGSLSQYEQFFGHLWGHRADESTLTPEQLEMRHRWNEVRTNILNNGNNQIRAMQNEVSQYTITWNRYQMNLKPSAGPSAINPKEELDNGSSNSNG